MPIENPSAIFDKFIEAHKNSQPAFLSPEPGKKFEPSSSEPLPAYTIVAKAPVFISDYAHNRLKEIGDALEQHALDPGKQKNLKEVVAFIYADFKEGYRQTNVVVKIFHSILSLFGLCHSSQQVEADYQKIQKGLEKKSPLPCLGNLHGLSPEEIEDRRQKHRTATDADYSKAALSKGPYASIFKSKEKEHEEQLKKLLPAERAIALAKLKEEACQETYDKHLPQCIERGFYDPAIIPYDIEHLLGKVEALDKPIVSKSELDSSLKKEVQKYFQAGKLNEAQMHRLQEDALQVAQLYGQAFPGKSFRDAFFLVRDLIRIATYQEFYDKGSFNGSDHGSKHIHNNILGSLALQRGMEKGKDYTIKDQLIEELTHFFHDIGYTAGLATTNFDCCKDHPFIGAKMIEANRDYFIHYLDQASYDTLHKCVLYHAIMYPDLTARQEIAGIHPNMIRAVTSISDACAVTYDRKTQEFWEQPRALVALARIKSFLILFPQYKQKLGDDIVKGPWAGYDENNPLDKMAYDVFLNTRQELFDMVEQYDIPKEKKDLFRQAIKQQFNAFKANITLGQYGAVLAGLESVPNKDKHTAEAPEYIPQVNIGVSIAYGVLKDLFGEDQANDSFKKLVEEFGGSMKDLNEHLQEISQGLSKGTPAKDRVVPTGIGQFKLLGKLAKPSSDPHQQHLDTNLKTALGKISEVFGEQQEFLPIRNDILKNLNVWIQKYEKNKSPPFGEFIVLNLLPILHLPTQKYKNQEIQDLQALAKQAELSPQDLEKIKGLIPIVLMSDNEYRFMRGPLTPAKRADVLKDALQKR